MMPSRSKGKEKGGSGKAYRNKFLRGMLRSKCTKKFFRNHLVFEDDASPRKGKIAGMRDVPVSTAILVDRRGANNLKNLVDFWNVEDGESPVKGTLYTSPVRFRLLVWEGGEATQKEAKIVYSMCKNDTDKKGR